VACAPSTPLSEVAALMSQHRVHCVLVDGVSADERGERLVWGVVSDLDLIRATVADDGALTARAIATTEALTVDSDDDLGAVGAALGEHACSHAVVVEGERPVGVVSTLDPAIAIAPCLADAGTSPISSIAR